MATPWSPYVIYAAGNQVTYSGNTYSSTLNYNLNRVPSDTVWWALSIPPGGVATVLAGTNITVTGTPENPQINAAAVSPTPAGTFGYPTSVQVDSYGRTTNVTAGSAPVSSVTGGAGIAVTGTTTPSVALAGVSPSPAGTYGYPTSVSVDAYGRVTAATAGVAGTALPNGTSAGNYALWNTSTSTWGVGSNPVRIGAGAGATSQTTNAVAIGATAGGSNQGGAAVAIGLNAGATNQVASAVAIGNAAGQTSQATNAIAIGASSGNASQSANAIAIGASAAQGSQGANAIAVGVGAGQSGQGNAAVSIGNGAGATSQGTLSIAIGQQAGKTTQGPSSVAIGANAGEISQGGSTGYAVSVGAYVTEQTGQGAGAISIGGDAATTSQGAGAIAIGRNAVTANQPANSIIINATGTAYPTPAASSTVIRPVRNQATIGSAASEVLTYRSDGEVVTAPNRFTFGGDLTLGANRISGSTTGVALATTAGIGTVVIGDANLLATTGTSNISVHADVNGLVINRYMPITVAGVQYWVPLLSSNPLGP